MTVDEFWHSQTNFHPNIRIEPMSRDLSRVSGCIEDQQFAREVQFSPGNV